MFRRRKGLDEGDIETVRKPSNTSLKWKQAVKGHPRQKLWQRLRQRVPLWNGRSPTLCDIGLGLTCCILGVLWLNYVSSANHSICRLRRPTNDEWDNLMIVFFPRMMEDKPSMWKSLPAPLPLDTEEGQYPSFGGMEFFSLELESVFVRLIHPHDSYYYEEQREETLARVDGVRFPLELEPDSDLEDIGQSCRRPRWKTQQFPTCNVVHETAMDRPPSYAENRYNATGSYLGSGHYRDVWLLEANHTDAASKNGGERLVCKRLPWKDDIQVDSSDMAKVQRDAIVMERLTNSPNIINLYGYCSVTLLTEAMDVGEDTLWRHIVPGTGHQEVVSPHWNMVSQNSYTAEQKLDIAIAMAESLADLHGFDGGVILNGQTHPEQWLRRGDRVLLNNFNHAEILDFHLERQEYCKVFRNSSGSYHAPEEYAGTNVDEGVDVFSFGNNIYCLLTGLWPFHDTDDDKIIQQKLVSRERAFVDPRWKQQGYIEGRLVELLERTWEHDTNHRASIFQVVQFLKETRREHDNGKSE